VQQGLGWVGLACHGMRRSFEPIVVPHLAFMLSLAAPGAHPLVERASKQWTRRCAPCNEALPPTAVRLDRSSINAHCSRRRSSLRSSPLLSLAAAGWEERAARLQASRPRRFFHVMLAWLISSRGVSHWSSGGPRSTTGIGFGSPAWALFLGLHFAFAYRAASSLAPTPLDLFVVMAAMIPPTN
jgi:hypothetical protein